MSSLLNKHGVIEIRMKGSTVPFGYDELLDKPGYLTPILEEMQALGDAKGYVRDGALSYREAAEWLGATTGRSISAQGLHKMIQKEAKNG
jgi:hypothetical protein